jgi:hypothetical protein
MDRTGQAALSLVFLIGGIVFVAGVTIALFAFNFINAGYGYEALQRIHASNAAGIADAILRLDRNKAVCSGGCSYTVPVGSVTANVTISATGVPATDQATITAQTTSALRSRTVTAIVNIHPATGQITLLSER